MHHRLEILGFLSRWGLLLQAALGVAAMTIVCFANASSVRQQASVVLADAVWDGKDKFYVSGAVSPPPEGVSAPHFIGGGYGRDWGWASLDGRNGQVWLHVPSGAEGVNTVIMRGVPYDSTSGEQASCRVLVVPENKRLFLVDARMALADGKEIQRLMAALQGMGEAAMFTGAPTQDVPRQKAQLRRGELYSVLVSHVGRPGEIETLRQAARDCVRKNRQVEVITDDPALAVRAADNDFLVDLVAPPRLAPSASIPWLRVYESMTKLQASLAERSINP